LNKTLLWRKDNKIDELKEKAIKLEPDQFPHYEKMMRVNPQNLHHSEDKLGQPVAIAHLGRSDPGLLQKTVSEEALREFTIYQLEYKRVLIQRLSHEKGYLYRTVRIVDLSGLGSKHLNPKALRAVRSILGLVQEHYPEMVCNVFYVNAPWVFSSLWGMIKPWINAATLEKIQILGADAKEVMLKKIDAKCLPKYLGGECTCADKGGCIPERDPDEGMTQIHVPRASVHEIKVEVGSGPIEPSSPSTTYLITWEFHTDRHNIDFEVIFRPFKTKSEPTPKPEQIVPKKRAESSQAMVEGGFETNKTGIISFIFDNYFSWTQGKTVHYRIDVTGKINVPTDEKKKAL